MTRRPAQGTLDVRRYIVRCSGFDDCTVSAATPAGAKYRAFKLAREAGYFSRGFHAFLANGVTARADRRPLWLANENPELGL